MKTRKRFIKVVGIFLRIFLDFNKEFKLRNKYGYEFALKKMEKVHIKRAGELFETAVSLGGVLIKLCQYLSTRRDILPESYIKILSKLQDNVPPVGFDKIKSVIDEEYKNDFPFKSIEEESLASASLGQTHRAKLKTGEDVVLKVLKPGIEKILDTDFAILFFVFKFFSHFSYFRENMDFYNLLDEFIKVTGDELNFIREANIAERLKDALKKFKYLKIPTIYKEFSNKKIIVMEYIDGIKITDKEKWIKKNNDPKLVSRRLVEIYFEQFLFVKLIHFDPHPGNIFVLENSNIALIDFGMAGEITDAMSSGINDGLSAIVKRDYVKLLEVLRNLGFLKKNSDIYILLPVVEFLFDEIFEKINLERNSVQNIDFKPVINDLVEIIYTQPFRIPYEWAYIGRTIGTLIGIVSSIYPFFNINEEMKQYYDLILKKSLPDLLENAYDAAKSTFNDILVLPGKVKYIIEKVEKGNIKFKVDFEEVDEKMIDLGSTFARGISAALSFFSGTFSYFLYIMNHKDGFMVFASFSIISFLFFLLYRKRTKKYLIRKQFMKGK